MNGLVIRPNQKLVFGTQARVTVTCSHPYWPEAQESEGPHQGGGMRQMELVVGS